MPRAQSGMDDRPARVLAQAVSHLGGQAALARLVGVSQPSVWGWISRRKPLPPQHVIKVEAELHRLGVPIDRHDLRPDVYPREEHQAPSGAIKLEPAR